MSTWNFSKKQGILSIVLQAHLPYVRHPEYDWFLEENWLFEAISETYIPLIRMLENLDRDQIPFRVTLSISPTLGTMLADELLQERYIKHIDGLIQLCEAEIKRLKGNKEQLPLAEMYHSLYTEVRERFCERYERDLLAQFRHFQKKGYLEIITTSASHCFLPHYRDYPQNIKAQILTAMQFHDRYFEEMPKGFWLPECGYFAGLEEYLKPYDIQYFLSSAHGILYASERPKYGLYAPLQCPNGIASFGRDRAASLSIWSSDDGFPSNPLYRDFYRDIGFDQPRDYIGQFVGDGTFSINTGLKYHAITGKSSLENKAFYNKAAADEQIKKDAETFVMNRIKQGETLAELMDRPPIIVCPFDAELFGHWWFEGPAFLEQVIRNMHEHADEIILATPGDYLEHYPQNQVAQPSFASWGEKGYGQIWLDGSNDWVYRHTHELIQRMSELVERYPDERGLKERTLNQAAREVILAQASDWPFIIKTGTTVPYAKKRLKEHISDFNKIYDTLCRNSVNTEWLTTLEKRNKIYPDLDYRIFKKK